MSNALMVQEKSNALITFDDEQIDLIKRQVAVGATNDELALFMYQCERTGLDPLARQIHFQKYNGKVSFITTIDGYRLIADRTGRYAGSDEAVFTDSVKARRFQNIFDAPKKATVTVWKLVGGVRMPFTASALWFEYFPKNDKQNFMWEKMPCTMLEKCAEAKALRKAFPADLSGVYTQDEMDQAHANSAIVHQPQTNESHRLQSGVIADSDGVIVDEPETIEGEIVEDDPVSATSAPQPKAAKAQDSIIDNHVDFARAGNWIKAINGIPRYAGDFPKFMAATNKLVEGGVNNAAFTSRSAETPQNRVMLYKCIKAYASHRDSDVGEFDALKAIHSLLKGKAFAKLLKPISTDELPPSASDEKARNGQQSLFPEEVGAETQNAQLM